MVLYNPVQNTYVIWLIYKIIDQKIPLHFNGETMFTYMRIYPTVKTAQPI